MIGIPPEGVERQWKNQKGASYKPAPFVEVVLTSLFGAASFQV